MARPTSRRSGSTRWLAVALLATASAAGAAGESRFEARRYTGDHGLILYRLFVPRMQDKTRRPILVLWLHGTEARGFDNLRQISGEEAPGLAALTSDSFQRESPALVVVPQCPPGRTWTRADGAPSEELQTTLDLVERLMEDHVYGIEDSRIYVEGRSMGEDGVRALLVNRPYMVGRMQPPTR